MAVVLFAKVLHCKEADRVKTFRALINHTLQSSSKKLKVGQEPTAFE